MAKVVENGLSATTAEEACVLLNNVTAECNAWQAKCVAAEADVQRAAKRMLEAEEKAEAWERRFDALLEIIKDRQ